jgi:type I restriction enzyme R subunit
MSLSDFPTPEDLRLRYYFQDAAIRAALEKIAVGQKKLLLSLATGTGKTVIAVHLLDKLGKAGQLTRALFVCDRDEIRTQGMSKLHSIFGDNAQIVTTDDPQPNAKILVSTYQTLNITADDDEPRFWKENFPKNYFSHIILDECHRSAWGKWSVILTDNPDAVHIGLTATPRIVIGGKKGADGRKGDEEITAHNLKYFGEPVYEYSIGAGQEDGYLAACEVIRRTVDLDKKEITKEDIERRSAIDPYTGKKVNPEEIEDGYNAKDYEVKLMRDDRVKAMTEDLFHFLLDTGGPYQKTIILCARDIHANQIMIAMNNLYEKWCKENRIKPREWYAFQCTGNPDLRPSADKLIPDFRGSKNSHYIAATVDLLSTGVDIPNLGNVVFFRYLESPISFYQMVGRGTRTGEPRGSKLMFRLYDYTNATRLFGEEFKSRAKPSKPEEPPEGVESPTPPYGDDKPKRKIIRIGEHKLISKLPGGEGAVRLIRELEDERECDLFDVLAKLGYSIPPKSRGERVAAFSYKNKQWLRQFPERTGNVLVSIARQFEKGGIEELEITNLFDEAEVVASGGFEALMGQKVPPEMLIQEMKTRLLT